MRLVFRPTSVHLVPWKVLSSSEPWFSSCLSLMRRFCSNACLIMIWHNDTLWAANVHIHKLAFRSFCRHLCVSMLLCPSRAVLHCHYRCLQKICVCIQILSPKWTWHKLINLYTMPLETLETTPAVEMLALFLYLNYITPVQLEMYAGVFFLLLLLFVKKKKFNPTHAVFILVYTCLWDFLTRFVIIFPKI